MDNTYRLKIQLHGNLFEAEGDKETVSEQFRAFQELLRLPVTPAPQAPGEETKTRADVPTNSVPSNEQDLNKDLNKIMQLQGKVVSLTVRPRTVDEALLLIMLGQKVLRGNEFCSGGVLLSGLVVTGGFSIGRIDRILEKMGHDGDLIITGEHRGKKYRLANSGLTKAKDLATVLLQLVA